MGRVAQMIGRFLASLLGTVLAAEMPDMKHPALGVQAPDVLLGLDLEHTEGAAEGIVAVDERKEIAPITPPFIPAPPEYPWPLFARREAYRRHPSYYTQSGSDAPILWYAAEQAKKGAFG